MYLNVSSDDGQTQCTSAELCLQTDKHYYSVVVHAVCVPSVTVRKYGQFFGPFVLNHLYFKIQDLSCIKEAVFIEITGGKWCCVRVNE